MNICELCIQKDKETTCPMCKHNPSNVLVDFFIEYYPVCAMGYADCIHDPAYIKHFYPDWYEELWGDKTVEEAFQEQVKEGVCNCTGSHCRNYDDEDK